MKTSFSKALWLLSAFSVALGAGVAAQGAAPVITSLSGNGVLVCSNLAPGSVASVEWASSLSGPWNTNWAGLEAVTADSNGKIQVSVPMFYRVRGASSPPDGMVWIPPGTFTMGSPTTEVGRYDNEGPQTAVTISRGFWLGKYEVTQGEYQSVMGTNPSYYNGDRSGPPYYDRNYGTDLSRPVEQVSWNDATNYCATLTQRERAAGRITTNSVYRLPTGAEWEYACRGWTSTRFSYGDDPSYTNLSNYAWYAGNSGDTTHPVGQKLPNLWGLHDTHGNVWEWCQDWWGGYPGGIAVDPQGPATGSAREHRGGGYFVDGKGCRSAMRGASPPGYTGMPLGFRVVLAPGQ